MQEAQLKKSRCPHVTQIQFTWAEIDEKRHNERACSSCGDTNVNQWLCLYHTCGYVGCGHRCQDHSSIHAKKHKHPLAMNLHNRKIFCHSCNSEVFFSGNQPPFSICDGGGANETMEIRNRHSHRSATTSGHSSDHNMKHEHKSNGYRPYHNMNEGSHMDDIHDVPPPTRYHGGGGFSYAPYVPGTVGFRNFGNTCYMNASLQALLNCPQLNHVFLDGLTLQPAPGSRICLSSVFQNLLREVWSPEPIYRSGRIVAPSMVSSTFRSFYPAFRGLAQQDAQEFLRLFIDRLHEELKHPVTYKALQQTGGVTIPLSVALKEPYGNFYTTPLSSKKRIHGSGSSMENIRDTVKSRAHPHSHSESIDILTNSDQSNQNENFSSSEEPKSTDSVSAKPLVNDALQYNSIISDVFRGTFRNTCECLQCGYTSTVIEPFYDLSVPIAGTQNNAPNSSLHVKTSHRSSNTSAKLSDSYEDHVRPLPTCDNESQPLSSPSLPSSTNNDSLSNSTSTATTIEETKHGKKNRARHIRKTLLHRFGSRNRRRSQSNSNDNTSWMQWFISSFKSMFYIFSWFVTPKTTLQDCLDAYFSDDDLIQDNQYYCERCKKLVDGTKRSELLHLPEVLCIHLKRFRHDFSLSSKLTHQVVFPLFGLDMSPYMAHARSNSDDESIEEESYETDSGISVPSPVSTLQQSTPHETPIHPSQILQYDLIALICHLGSGGNFGHYTCYAVHQETQQWYEYDDERVQPCEVGTVTSLLSQAYILFYKKNDEAMLPIRQEACLLEREDSIDSLLPMFIDREWILKFNSFSQPGPITNSRLLCEKHGALLPSLKGQESEHFLRIPTALWEYFRKKFSGGPSISSLHVCTHCEKGEDQLKQRRETEYLTVFKGINEFRTRGNSTSAYAIDLKWFNTWQQFVEGRNSKPPGPIDNMAICQRLSLALKGNRHPQAVLRLLDGADYGTLSGAVWCYLHGIYGGGPTLCLYESASNSDKSTSSINLMDEEEPLSSKSTSQSQVIALKDNGSPPNSGRPGVCMDSSVNVNNTPKINISTGSNAILSGSPHAADQITSDNSIKHDQGSCNISVIRKTGPSEQKQRLHFSNNSNGLSNGNETMCVCESVL